MSKYVKSQDSTDPWMIDESNQTWTLGKNATIAVAGEAAINIAAGNTGNTIKLRGDLDASGAGSEGLRMEGDGTIVQIRKSSLIEAEDGIYNNSAGSRIENFGIIEGTDRGIASDGAIDIVNKGKVSADAAVNLLGDSSVTNLKGGLIEGDTVGVRISTFGSADIVNDGKIVADGLAVHVNSAGNSTLTNNGKIVGDVQFGSGNDRIDTVDGKITGQVSGGLGHDDYVIASKKIDLFENAGGGYDEVTSYVSHKLRTNFEVLYLAGEDDLKGTGNGLDNSLKGNSADNILRGKGGEDRIDGAGGDDLMFGGSGPDTFVFKPYYDHDTIVDFDAAEDYVAILEVFDSFDDVAPLISQHGSDTWISLGSGDRLILKDVDAGDLNEDNVVFNIPM
jgi:Ca2+-binding RTX toxin-like protein